MSIFEVTITESVMDMFVYIVGIQTVGIEVMNVLKLCSQVLFILFFFVLIYHVLSTDSPSSK